KGPPPAALSAFVTAGQPVDGSAAGLSDGGTGEPLDVPAWLWDSPMDSTQAEPALMAETAHYSPSRFTPKIIQTALLDRIVTGAGAEWHDDPVVPAFARVGEGREAADRSPALAGSARDGVRR